MRIRSGLGSALVVGSLLIAGCGDDGDDQAAPTTTDGGGDVDTDDTVDTGDFDTLDANGDSFLDIDEVAEWFDDAGTFNEWDIDSDSELDADEINGNAFELWDGDDDGSITASEWESAVELWYPASSRPTVFADWDGDGDSELDADEFREQFDFSALGESWTETQSEETFRESYFELYDTNDDGMLSRNEFDSGKASFGTPEE